MRWWIKHCIPGATHAGRWNITAELFFWQLVNNLWRFALNSRALLWANPFTSKLSSDKHTYTGWVLLFIGFESSFSHSVHEHVQERLWLKILDCWFFENIPLSFTLIFSSSCWSQFNWLLNFAGDGRFFSWYLAWWRPLWLNNRWQCFNSTVTETIEGKEYKDFWQPEKAAWFLETDSSM